MLVLCKLKVSVAVLSGSDDVRYRSNFLFKFKLSLQVACAFIYVTLLAVGLLLDDTLIECSIKIILFCKKGFEFTTLFAYSS